MDNDILTQNAEEAQEAHLPFLVFKIDEVLYAVNGETINTIFVLDQPVTRVPMTEQHIKGIINVRGEVVPLVDVRILFGLPTAEKEKQDFIDMLEQRKQDHIHWVAELEKSVETGAEFKLATDPHQCKFGKWYDSYKSQHEEVMFLLRQIKEPHQRLHAAAKMALQTCFEHDDESAQCDCVEHTLDVLKNEDMRSVVDLLEQTKQSYNTSKKQMVIILQKDSTQIGILVDEVMEVIDIEEVCPLNDITTTHHSRFVHGVGTVEQYNKDILMLDVEQIVHNSHNSVAV